jgi:hypothetical protein
MKVIDSSDRAAIIDAVLHFCLLRFAPPAVHGSGKHVQRSQTIVEMQDEASGIVSKMEDWDLGI